METATRSEEVSTMAVNDPAPTIWAKVQQITDSIEGHISSFFSHVKAALGWAGQELPKVEKMLTVVAAVTAAAFPEALAAEAFMTTVMGAVKFAEGMIKTTAGVVMQPSEAANIGAVVAGPALPGEKFAVAKQQVQNLHPGIEDNVINLHLEAAVAQVNSGQGA
jgi:hypothetical protein